MGKSEKSLNKLNLNYYKGVDAYSDGSIEEEILKISEEHDDFSEVLKNDNRWAILYHLTPLRRNLLEWYNFDKNSHVLEIGAGCGAITGLLCEKVKTVTAVELSKRRAEIILNRTNNYDNIEIIVGNLNDIEFDKKFDYITLIGVLEYAGRFTSGENPYAEFLKKVKSLLKPNGTLIIAIENKFGLKYFAGAREDHTGKLFDSIENYKEDTGVRTFGKSELEELLSKIGFNHLDFHYPMPDYKIPTQIFSDEFSPKYGQMDNFSNAYDKDRYAFFDEKLAWQNIIQNKQFPFFANSFLVIAKQEITEEKKIYSNFKRKINDKFQIETSLVKTENEIYSLKSPLNVKSHEHIETIYNNYLFLNDKLKHLPKINLVNCTKLDHGLKFDFAKGICFTNLIEKAIFSKNKNMFFKYFEVYLNLIKEIHNPIIQDFDSEHFKEIFGKVKIPKTPCVDYANIDLIFDNLFIEQNKWHIIDYEWLMQGTMPFNFIIARAIFNIYLKYNDIINEIISHEQLFAHLKISASEANIYWQMEKNFIEYLHKDAKFVIGGQYVRANHKISV